MDWKVMEIRSAMAKLSQASRVAVYLTAGLRKPRLENRRSGLMAFDP